MVLICEDGWDTGVIELDFFVVYSDEMDGGMRRDEWCECIGDDLGYWALIYISIDIWKEKGENKHTS